MSKTPTRILTRKKCLSTVKMITENNYSSYDWFYDYSDDPRMWQRGSEQRRQIDRDVT